MEAEERAIATVRGRLTQQTKSRIDYCLLIFARAWDLTHEGGNEHHIEIDRHQHQQRRVVVRAGRRAVDRESVAREQGSLATMSFAMPFNGGHRVSVADVTIVNVDLHVELAFTSVT